jgi:hypothetical protein
MPAVGCRHEWRPPAPRIITGSPAFDLDHVGAEIGQNLPGPRPGQDAGEFEHA